MHLDYKLYKHAWIYDGSIAKELKLNKEQVNELLSHGGWMVRNIYDFDCQSQTNFWFVLKDTFGGMEELSTKTRNQVRKGLANYTVRRVTKDEMMQFGYSIFTAAAASYKIHLDTPSLSSYNRRIQEADSAIEFWGAFNSNNQMVAFSINHVIDTFCDYQTMKAIPEDMKNYAYYALIYVMNQYYLEERKLDFVNDGARSITEHSNIQPFLESKFNFRKAYCHLKIYYKWWLGIIIWGLYPFRHFIPNNAVQAILNMHGMQSRLENK